MRDERRDEDAVTRGRARPHLLDALTRTAESQSRARLPVVRGARHDVLNDVNHRSVAAETVAFLETLRNGLVPVVPVESSTR